MSSGKRRPSCPGLDELIAFSAFNDNGAVIWCIITISCIVPEDIIRVQKKLTIYWAFVQCWTG